MGVWGSQQVTLDPHARYQGVFGMWYGKWAGLARSGDALLHGNSAGAAPHGGVLLVCGDDHMARSSTVATQSETMLMSPMIPVLVPSGVQEYLDLGVHGFAMSRYSGSWLAFKALDDTIECSASVSVDPARISVRLPEDFALPPGGLGLAPARPAAVDGAAHPRAAAARGARLCAREPAQLRRATTARGRGSASSPPASRISTCGRRSSTSASTSRPPRASASACTSSGSRGRSSRRVCTRSRSGWRRSSWSRKSARSSRTRSARCSTTGPTRGGRASLGKRDEESGPNEWLLPPNGELTAEQVALVIAARLARFHADARIEERAAWLRAKEEALAKPSLSPQLRGYLSDAGRVPYFCSGCPHNSSTRVPEGSEAIAGVGCHFMATYIFSGTKIFSPMGSEGAAWVGPRAVHRHQAHLRQHGRRHVLPLGPARDPRRGRRQRRHHVQDPLQRRDGGDRRPAAAGAAQRARAHPPARSRRRRAHRRRHRPAGEVWQGRAVRARA